VKEDLIICRCEEVSLREITEAIAGGAVTSRQVKLATRAGMGFCQGRTCRHFVEQLTGDEPGAEPLGSMAYKPPVRPTSFGRLAGEGQE
jgi:NAD(P)H-nitrite reductase large subunit